MSSEQFNYNDLLLDGAMDIILEAADEATPRVTESTFKSTVVSILQRPFHKGHLQAYLRFVKELTNPLHVVSDDNPREILFTVPALIQSFVPSLPTRGAPNTENAMRAIHAESDRGVDINPVIAKYLKNITQVKNHGEAVLTPLREILLRYGVEIDISDENDLVRDVETAPVKPVAEAPLDSSYTDEYE